MLYFLKNQEKETTRKAGSAKPAATATGDKQEIKAPEAPKDEKPRQENKLRRSHSKVKLKAPKLDKILHCLFYKVCVSACR